MSELHWLICRNCDWRTLCDLVEITRRMRQIGMLRREAKPTGELIESLWNEASGRLVCDQCGQAGLAMEPHTDDWDDEPGTHRKCSQCGGAIDPERLEVFPETTMCMPCQTGLEMGRVSETDEPDYCPRCGAVMELKKTTSGVTRYRMVCPECRKVSA